MRTLQIYGDPTNRTICVRGDIDLTHWASIFDDDDSNVIALSDGTVIEFRFEKSGPGWNDHKCQTNVLAIGSALQLIIPEDMDQNEILIQGDIKWVLVAAKNEFVQIDGTPQ